MIGPKIWQSGPDVLLGLWKSSHLEPEIQRLAGLQISAFLRSVRRMHGCYGAGHLTFRVFVNGSFLL